ncbi:ferrous iron transport protein B [Catalinimonas niigatensis]|uniref:ferrous iron transport protein B n=1 Tax=Catalinimonas niigatensis TaxID=1397264 RepID=UPI002665ECBC|nr:ferrous iron transport protein B [Catalinimonas niigatensis]WPP50815.1 ferrous iron transport protein B [Catalinimonas niigatensis]
MNNPADTLLHSPPPKTKLSIALVGNPNSGKSTIFNLLTGLNQKVGNYPGVTVDKKSGKTKLSGNTSAEIIDLPGTYSLYPRAADEKVVLDVLMHPEKEKRPDVAVVIADMNNLERNLLLFTQIRDLSIPSVLVLNMADIARKKGTSVDLKVLSHRLGNVPVVSMNARSGEGLDELKQVLSQPIAHADEAFLDVYPLAPESIAEVKQMYGVSNYYEAYQWLQSAERLRFIDDKQEAQLKSIRNAFGFDPNQLQITETTERYRKIQQILQDAVRIPESEEKSSLSDRIDHILTHKVWGYLSFFVILFLIFQAIFAWASVPMDFIDYLFAEFSGWIQNNLPDGILTSLLAEGIVPGVGGIVIFVPQIAILFAFIALLEESGYMSRVVFLMDKVMRKVGLNGRSVVPLISGLACAIPAIMATRSIDSWKDRLITIMVTPLMSCSARLPVYTVLIALVVPASNVWGFINLQGIVLMGMYLLGFLAALGSAWVMKLIVKTKERSFLIMEMPAYRWPRWGNVGFTVLEKSKTFVFEAGKIIFAVSIVLWVLASYGPGDDIAQGEQQVREQAENSNDPALIENLDVAIATSQLENSYAGKFGKWIEPVIRPLGYDWKIGIALITSFAAREVFVGTMATLYSVGEDFDDESTIIGRMRSERNPETGQQVFRPAVAFSLLVFYAFAMQCMSTIAVVYRETKGWKWPVIQTVYMTVLAYVSALAVYQLFS